MITKGFIASFILCLSSTLFSQENFEKNIALYNDKLGILQISDDTDFPYDNYVFGYYHIKNTKINFYPLKGPILILDSIQQLSDLSVDEDSMKVIVSLHQPVKEHFYLVYEDSKLITNGLESSLDWTYGHEFYYLDTSYSSIIPKYTDSIHLQFFIKKHVVISKTINPILNDNTIIIYATAFEDDIRKRKELRAFSNSEVLVSGKRMKLKIRKAK